MSSFLDRIKGGLIVSCQAVPEDPTYGPPMMVAFALSALRGGAVGLRVNSVDDIKAIRAATDLPIIGIWKRPGLDGKGHIITPTIDDVEKLIDAGSDIIALDATDRVRPGGLTAEELIKQAKQYGVPIMADCNNVEDAINAEKAGADIVAPTLSHFSAFDPDLKMLTALKAACSVPVIAEGGYWTPEDIETGFKIGAHAIVVGSAITRPWLITERLVKSTPRFQGS